MPLPGPGFAVARGTRHTPTRTRPRHATGSLHPAECFVCCAHGRRDGPAVPQAVQAAGRGLCGERDGDLAARPAGQSEDLAPGRPQRRTRADRGADRRHRRGHDGRRRALQHRPRRADHRHQHGLPGQEGLQQMGWLGPDAGRGTGHRDRRGRGGRGRTARRARHTQDAHRLVRRCAQRAGDCAGRRSRRRSDAHRARSHPRAGLQGLRRTRHRGPHQELREDPGGGQWRHHQPAGRRARCCSAPAPTPS